MLTDDNQYLTPSNQQSTNFKLKASIGFIIVCIILLFVLYFVKINWMAFPVIGMLSIVFVMLIRVYQNKNSLVVIDKMHIVSTKEQDNVDNEERKNLFRFTTKHMQNKIASVDEYRAFISRMMDAINIWNEIIDKKIPIDDKLAPNKVFTDINNFTSTDRKLGLTEIFANYDKNDNSFKRGIEWYNVVKVQFPKIYTMDNLNAYITTLEFIKNTKHDSNNTLQPNS